MSFMKRLVGKGGGTPAQPEPASKPQDNALGLMHLRKLFTEFRHPSANATQKEQEDKLYNMLPLFCKTFGNVPASSMTEKFGDILQFCSHVSKLMVTEVRRRASNQSTEEASCAIVKFLEIESTEVSSQGWMLLTAINLLSMGTQALIDCMTAASLPSTLVKCLYLFFDLPEIVNPDVLEPGCELLISLLSRLGKKNVSKDKKVSTKVRLHNLCSLTFVNSFLSWWISPHVK